MLLPSAVTLSCSELRTGRWRFVYEERFAPTPRGREAVTNALRMAAGGFAAQGLRLRRLGRYAVRITGTGLPREVVGGCLAMEFMGWSRLGQVKMIDLMGMAAIGAGEVAKEHRADGR